MTSPPAAHYLSAESSPLPDSRFDNHHPDSDIHIAAEALESLRTLSVPSSSVSPPPSAGFVLPPINTAAPSAPSHLRQNHHKISTSYRARHSPYHSRSSSFSETSPAPASPALPSIDATIRRPSNQYSNFLKPIVSSAVRVYENSKSFSPFKVSAEKLESVISSKMTPSTESPEQLAATPPPPSSSSASSSSMQLPPLRSLNSTPSNTAGLPKWLVKATSLATTLSHENRQRLRYCLHLLKLANTHIATKVNQLQELLNEEKAAQQKNPQRRKRDPKVLFTQTVNNIKKDIIWTIRKVVSALSTYAGNSLPEPARTHVRTYILRLPQRWVTSLTTETASGAATPRASEGQISVPGTPDMRHHRRTFSGESTDEGSSLLSPTTSNSSANTSLDDLPSYNTEAGNRVLSLANEALDMLGSIINVVDETLARADDWCADAAQNAQNAQSAGANAQTSSSPAAAAKSAVQQSETSEKEPQPSGYTSGVDQAPDGRLRAARGPNGRDVEMTNT